MSAFFDAVIINRNVSVENVKKVFTFFLFLHAGMNKNTNIVPTIMELLATFFPSKIKQLNPNKDIHLQPFLDNADILLVFSVNGPQN